MDSTRCCELEDAMKEKLFESKTEEEAQEARFWLNRLTSCQSKIIVKE